MTKRATATQAQVRRMINAARLAGLRVAGIKPDGTIITYQDGDNPLVPVDQHDSWLQDSDALRWGDAAG
jgi:hypothetical protein